MDESSELVDARPVRAARTESAWERALLLRDRMAAHIRRTLDEAGVDALVLVSQAGNYPPWVRLEAWLPAGGGSTRHRRGELEFVIDVAPYCEHDVLCTARAAWGKRRIAATGWPASDFSAEDVRQWIMYALGRSGKPSNYHPVRDVVVGFLLAFIPFVHGPHHNKVSERYRNALSLNGAKCLGLASLLVGYLGFVSGAGDSSGLGPALILLALAGFVAVALMVRSRTNLVAVPRQPTVPPRNLVMVDSWNTILSELGRDAAPLRQTVMEAIGAAKGAGIDCMLETYSYRTPNGYEQRDRLVVTKGQSVVHVHIYQFGSDLFVGWNAYLNCAQWGETAPVSKRVVDGVATEFRELRPAGYIPNQLDLIDLSSLGELVHRRLEHEIKGLLARRSIDQEIDFEIVRGDRIRSLDRARSNAEPDRSGVWRGIARGIATLGVRSETEIARNIAPSRPRAPSAGRRKIGQTPVWLAAAVLLQFLSGAMLQLFGATRIDYSPSYFFYYFPSPSPVILAFLLWYAGTGLRRAVVGGILLFLLSTAQLFGTHFLLSMLSNTARIELSGPINIAATVLVVGIFVLVLALYLPALRQTSVWLVAMLVWAGGQILVQFYFRGLFDTSLLPYAYTVPRALAFTYMGYRLQQAIEQGHGR